jgi:hypothetical protein
VAAVSWASSGPPSTTGTIKNERINAAEKVETCQPMGPVNSGNGWKWMEMDGNGWKWMEIVNSIGKCLKEKHLNGETFWENYIDDQPLQFGGHLKG